MIYLTYNDAPSGVYFSQVTDVCNFLNNELKASIKLISLISIRNFSENKKRIKSEFPKAIVLPMFPMLHNWKWNFFTLFCIFIFFDSKRVIARGPFAAYLAYRLKKTGLVKWICFDARGAAASEINEYRITNNEKIKKQIFVVEKNAIQHSDFRIAVSNTLVNYWKEEFKYQNSLHQVIPCTLNSKYFKKLSSEGLIKEKRKTAGFTDEDIIFVFSGSSAQWHSLNLCDDFLYTQMKNNLKIKVLFLYPKPLSTLKIVSEYKKRISFNWIQESEMQTMLSICDYGLLIREKTITNQVASPVKFAEYLASGLNIIISKGLGDYSDFVKENNCGIVLNKTDLNFHPLSYSEKQKNSLLAFTYFSKQSHKKNYERVIL